MTRIWLGLTGVAALLVAYVVVEVRQIDHLELDPQRLGPGGCARRRGINEYSDRFEVHERAGEF